MRSIPAHSRIHSTSCLSPAQLTILASSVLWQELLLASADIEKTLACGTPACLVEPARAWLDPTHSSLYAMFLSS